MYNKAETRTPSAGPYRLMRNSEMIIKQMRVGPMDVFSYVLGCENTHKGLVIDPAGEEERILDSARGLGLTIESVVNTHGHPDHTSGNRKIAEQTGAKIYMHTLDDQFFNTQEGQFMAMQMGFTPSPSADVLLKDKDIIKQYNIDKIPCTIVQGAKDYGIRLYGIPAGYEFPSLLLYPLLLDSAAR